MNKQDLKQNVNILTGRTIRRLNRMFVLVANDKLGYAKLHFKDQTMWHYEDVTQAAVIHPVLETEIRDNTNLPKRVLDIYSQAQKIKNQVETMGISNIQVKYSGAATEYTDDGIKVVHMVYLQFPVDKQHRKNQVIAMGMAITDRVLNCYVSGR